MEKSDTQNLAIAYALMIAIMPLWLIEEALTMYIWDMNQKIIASLTQPESNSKKPGELYWELKYKLKE